MIEYVVSLMIAAGTAVSPDPKEQVQRRAALCSTGAFRRPPSTLLFHEMGWEDLSGRRKNAQLVTAQLNSSQPDSNVPPRTIP